MPPRLLAEAALPLSMGSFVSGPFRPKCPGTAGGRGPTVPVLLHQTAPPPTAHVCTLHPVSSAPTSLPVLTPPLPLLSPHPHPTLVSSSIVDRIVPPKIPVLKP